jgi:hypothetical protein
MFIVDCNWAEEGRIDHGQMDYGMHLEAQLLVKVQGRIEMTKGRAVLLGSIPSTNPDFLWSLVGSCTSCAFP